MLQATAQLGFNNALSERHEIHFTPQPLFNIQTAQDKQPHGLRRQFLTAASTGPLTASYVDALSHDLLNAYNTQSSQFACSRYAQVSYTSHMPLLAERRPGPSWLETLSIVIEHKSQLGSDRAAKATVEPHVYPRSEPCATLLCNYEG